MAWLWRTGIGIILGSVAAVIIVYFRPSAGGSGIPELIAFLNGTSIRHIYNVRTLLAKFISCAFAVSSGMNIVEKSILSTVSGLFAGPEGPMIHIGALVGAGLSQFKSDSMGIEIGQSGTCDQSVNHIYTGYFKRFRNPEDRRNFISAGAAAGVSSAFGSPVGGLLFSMEEVSSFWSNRLTWQVRPTARFSKELSCGQILKNFRYSSVLCWPLSPQTCSTRHSLVFITLVRLGCSVSRIFSSSQHWIF